MLAEVDDKEGENAKSEEETFVFTESPACAFNELRLLVNELNVRVLDSRYGRSDAGLSSPGS